MGNRINRSRPIDAAPTLEIPVEETSSTEASRDIWKHCTQSVEAIQVRFPMPLLTLPDRNRNEEFGKQENCAIVRENLREFNVSRFASGAVEPHVTTPE